ncbi:MAG: PAS domain-containing protein, partial [Chloroflexales bacterium]|nr:PAS domain-containing protein [Chloroflexales bacterium]
MVPLPQTTPGLPAPGPPQALLLQAAIARCARTLLRANVAPHQRDAFLAAVFEEFRTSAGLAHVGLYAFHERDGALHYRPVFQLPDPKITAPSTPVTALSPQVAEPLLRGEPVAARAEQAFVPGTVNHAFWQRRNIAALASALVTVDGRAWGFAGFGAPGPYRPPDAEELAMLGALAEMVGAFLGRLEANIAFERQRAHAQALAACSGALLAQLESADAASDVLIGALQHLLDAVGCLRAYIYETRAADEGDFVAVAIAEACAPGTTSDPRTGRLPARLFPPWLVADLFAGRSARGTVADLLGERPDSVRLLTEAGAASVLLMPLHFSGCLWGFLGLSDADVARSWSDGEVQMLRTAAEMFATFFQSRRLLESLRERDYFIQRVTAASPDLIYVFDLREQRNVFANREVYSLLGYTSEEARGLGPDILATLMTPEDFARIPEIRARLRAADNEVIEYEYRARRPDGATRWLLSREVVFARDERDHPTQLLGLARDITETKEARLAIEQSASQLRTISDAIPDGYLYQVVQRRDGSYVRFNYVSGGVERLLGLSPEVAMADPGALHDTILPEDRPAVDAADLESVRNLAPFEVEARRRKADGRIGWFQMRSVPHELADGLILWNGVCLDISRRKLIELALTQTNQTLRRRIDELAAL